MYTRSRSSTGGPGAGFGGGRGNNQQQQQQQQQMNPGNGNFQGQNSYNNHQGGNYQQPNYNKPGMVQQQQQQQPGTPFKGSGGAPGTPVQQQAMKMKQQNPTPNQQGPNQLNSQQAISSPATPKLKPILKQSGPPGTAPAAAQNPSTPSPVPPPSANSNASPVAANVAVKNPGAAAVAATAPIKTGTPNPAAKPVPNPIKTTPANVAAVATAEDSAANKTEDPQNAANLQSTEGMDSDDPRRWMEDEQGKWMDTDDQSGQWMDTEDGQQQVPKWRRFKKLSANKPNKKLKRLRMNQRLRKTLMPKNAIMVLNEMKAGVQFTFPETQAIMPNSLFLVHAELEGKVYVGQGLSKPLARQNAAENALKCLLLEKMTAAAMKERVEADGDTPMEASEGQAAAGEGADGQTPAATPKEGETAKEGEETTPEEGDDIPWSSLASFALYKLFLEWQNQGTVVPIPRPGVPPMPKNRTDPKPVVEKVLPPNALDIHPVMLLNQMRPGTTYNEVERVGNPPNIQFTLGVEINGQSFTGSAKNKKDAKKMAAKEALKALYNLEYPEEAKTEVAAVEPVVAQS